MAQEQLQKNKQFAARRTIEPTLLQGMLVCKNCGYSYYRTSSKTTKRKIYYYRCPGSDNHRERGRICQSRPIRQDYVDDLVWQHLMQLLENPDLIQQEIKNRTKQVASSNPIIQRKDKLIKQKVKLKKSIDKLLDAYQEHLISLEELRKRIPALRKQETTLNAELKSLEANELYGQQSKTIITDIESFLVQLRFNADKLDIENKKKILRLLVKDILIAEDAIIINHCIKLKGGLVGENEKSYLLRKGGIIPLTYLTKNRVGDVLYCPFVG